MSAAKFSCSTAGSKVTSESTHLLYSAEQEAAKEPQARSVSLRHLHVGKQPAASDVFRRFKYQRADDPPPFPPAPVRPAAGSETHFLALPLKVALQTHKQEAALFHVPPLHAAHVKTREAGRCARVSWSGVRCRILSLCCLSCHHSRNKTEGRFSPSPARLRLKTPRLHRK